MIDFAHKMHEMEKRLDSLTTEVRSLKTANAVLSSELSRLKTSFRNVYQIQ